MAFVLAIVVLIAGFFVSFLKKEVPQRPPEADVARPPRIGGAV